MEDSNVRSGQILMIEDLTTISKESSLKDDEVLEEVIEFTKSSV